MTWIEPPSTIASPELRAAVAAWMPRSSGLAADILARRGLGELGVAHAFLDPDAYTPAPASDLPDLLAAVERLQQAIAQGRRVAVWGDFDVDGQTSTALLLSVLRELGADVRAYVPHRAREGHGVHVPALEQLLAGGLDVLLTCDTGSDAGDAVRYAQARGVAVLVTDHHELPARLPPADALVNPHRLPAGHPLRGLPGVGVAYKLAEALCSALGRPEVAARHLDLVALGIVADVAEQRDDTRYLLQRGLALLRRPQRIGLQALYEVARIEAARVSSEQIGFGIGPRLNAIGRLGDANLAVELLTTGDAGRARVLAGQMEALNAQRRLLTEQSTAAALQQLADQPTLLKDRVLVLSSPHWQGGIVGLVAARLSDQYARPAVVLVESDGQLAGSARSVPGCDITAALGQVADLLTRYGGHAGAAGMSLPVDRLQALREALSRAVDALWDRSAAPAGTSIDAYVHLPDLTLDLADELAHLAPFGQGNPEIHLAVRTLALADHRAFGRNEEHREITVQDAEGCQQRVTWWRGADQPLPPPGQPFDLAFVLKGADYRGRRALQVDFVDLRRASEPTPLVGGTRRQVVDWRGAPDAPARVEALHAAGEAVVWAEGLAARDVGGVRRDQLDPAPALVVWSAPPGPRELADALARVRPQTVYIVGRYGRESGREFARRLAGMVKYSLAHEAGRVDLPRMAAALGQRLVTVRRGLAWLEALGQMAIVEWQEDAVLVAAGRDTGDAQAAELLASELEALLAETDAYRGYLARADLDLLLS